LNKSFLTLAAAIYLLFVFTSVVAAESDEKPLRRVECGLMLQDYEWSEFDDNNFKFVEESGYLYGLTCDVDSMRNILGFRGGITLFTGEVDYDGHTWSYVPVKTDVFYLGSQFYADVVPNFRFATGILVYSFAGIGFRGWLRDLADTETEEGVYVKGAEEWWWNVYARAGAGLSYPILESLEIFTEAGSKIPIYAVNHANVFVQGSPSVNLEPQQRFSPFCDLGLRWNRFTAKLSYDPLWFNKSDSVSSSGMYILHQPKSEAEMINFTVAANLQF